MDNPSGWASRRADLGAMYLLGRSLWRAGALRVASSFLERLDFVTCYLFMSCLRGTQADGEKPRAHRARPLGRSLRTRCSSVCAARHSQTRSARHTHKRQTVHVENTKRSMHERVAARARRRAESGPEDDTTRHKCARRHAGRARITTGQTHHTQPARSHRPPWAVAHARANRMFAR